MMSRSAENGFTLIELMVVLVIIGIASAAIGLSIRPDPLLSLRKDAQGLAQVLTLAQAEARADGRTIQWRADTKGYGFSRRDDNGRDQDRFKDDKALRHRAWLTPSLQVRVEPKQRLRLTAEWIGEPLDVILSNGQDSLTVSRTAAGQVVVR